MDRLEPLQPILVIDLFPNAAKEPHAEIILDQDMAWRVFTKGVHKERALAQAEIPGESPGFQGAGRSFDHRVE